MTAKSIGRNRKERRIAEGRNIAAREKELQCLIDQCFRRVDGKGTAALSNDIKIGVKRIRVASTQNTNAHLSLFQKELEPR
jgi:hypothetical protein